MYRFLPLRYICRHWGLSGKYDHIKESGKPANDSRVNFILFFSSKLLFLSCLFFPINLKTLSSVFLIFHSFSPITGSYFCDWDVIIEFQIYSASKITHLQVHCTDFYYKDTFAGIGEQVESMIKSGRVENWQATQGLASFFFFHQSICFFLACFFPISLKTLSPVFLISYSFSPITGSYFYHCDVIMQIQN